MFMLISTVKLKLSQIKGPWSPRGKAFKIICQLTKRTKLKSHFTSYRQLAVCAMLTCPVLYSQAAIVYAYPGLPPITEMFPEADSILIMWKCPVIDYKSPVIV